MLQSQWYKEELSKSDADVKHRSLSEEYSFFEAVKEGNIEFVQENCKEEAFSNPEGMGVLSKNALTNLKYHFVITTAFVTRLCVEAGMEMEQAFRLSDFYILKLDNLYTAQAVSALHDQMVLDFTGKMRLLQKNIGTSKPVTECIDYIYVHIKERITVEDLAAHTGLSPSYLSRLFKKEIGISISDYIREKKIEKAQNLLKFCDYSLIEIATYLSFSSQSHFIQQFKKIVGMTPKKYRDLNYCTVWNTTANKKPDTAAP
jgi:AraC family transcriptional regulator